ncbi:MULTISPECIES: DUF6887 family protein [unclassified Microcoleus]|uniref:DUF6887 family protein n=2 Tax=unclassified Microcoleus TaxID=2642155 RepID=UPI002FD70143
MPNRDGTFWKIAPDRAACQAYLDRFSQRPKSIIGSPMDPDFDAKIQAAIRQKLEASRSSQPANNTVERNRVFSLRFGVTCRRSVLPLSRKHCLTLEMIRNLDREIDLQKIGRINRYARCRSLPMGDRL